MYITSNPLELFFLPLTTLTEFCNMNDTYLVEQTKFWTVLAHEIEITLLVVTVWEQLEYCKTKTNVANYNLKTDNPFNQNSKLMQHQSTNLWPIYDWFCFYSWTSTCGHLFVLANGPHIHSDFNLCTTAAATRVGLNGQNKFAAAAS